MADSGAGRSSEDDKDEAAMGLSGLGLGSGGVERQYVDDGDAGDSSEEEGQGEKDEEEEEEEEDEAGPMPYVALIGGDSDSDGDLDADVGEDKNGSTDVEEDEFGPFLDAAIHAALDCEGSQLRLGGGLAGGAPGDIPWAPEPEEGGLAPTPTPAPALTAASASAPESIPESVFTAPSIAPLTQARIDLIKTSMGALNFKPPKMGGDLVADALLRRKARLGDERR